MTAEEYAAIVAKYQADLAEWAAPVRGMVERDQKLSRHNHGAPSDRHELLGMLRALGDLAQQSDPRIRAAFEEADPCARTLFEALRQLRVRL